MERFGSEISGTFGNWWMVTSRCASILACTAVLFPCTSLRCFILREGGREGVWEGREGRRGCDGGREGVWEGGREGREGVMEGGREGGREGDFKLKEKFVEKMMWLYTRP